MDKKIAFLGGGNMAEALIKGLLAAGTARPDQIMVFDVSADRLAHLKKAYSIEPAKTNNDAAREAGVIILSVKPQVVERVLGEIAGSVDTSKLVVSIAAGVSLAKIEKALADGARVVRVMPNTPALVLAGAAALASGKNATSDDLA
ncbi:MAG TPA: NAD(P)-binding domain-containing protein, partial [Nitrospirota bacterium]|nr:NAD(P)-binding domain-containing protein [Nitrospirota bacterium]